MIKPDFWKDEKIGKLSVRSRLLFIGMWNFADDSGVVRADPIYLRSEIFTYDDISKNEMEKCINELLDLELMFLINQNEETYFWIKNFLEHQIINRPSEFRYIEVKDDDYSIFIDKSLINHESINGKVKVKDKVKDKVKVKDAIIESFKKTWFDKFSFYQNKYSNLDYNLQFELIIDYIEKHPKWGIDKDWNLTIQNWLSKCRPNYYHKPNTGPESKKPKPETDDQKLKRLKGMIKEFDKIGIMTDECQDQNAKDKYKIITSTIKELEGAK